MTLTDNFMYQDDQLRANTLGGSVSIQNIKEAKEPFRQCCCQRRNVLF